MNKIIDYYIVTSVPCEDITSRVINMIQEDWQPIGGMVYMEEGICVQTMVKYRDVIKPADFGAVKDPEWRGFRRPTADELYRAITEGQDKIKQSKPDIEALTRLQTKFHSRYKTYLGSKGKSHHADATKRAWLDVCKELSKLRLEQNEN